MVLDVNMLSTKKMEELTEEEFDDFMNFIKLDRFKKWSSRLDEDDDAKQLSEEVEKRLGYKKGTPIHIMITAFFAGVDAGIDIMNDLAFTDDEENPASAPTPTGPAN